ncbi:MAG: ABC transporter [Anaerolineae bacterium SM23_ 63]|nr:MAG: ABC transporter [Anaerolineae bacterium SM23_ 63]
MTSAEFVLPHVRISDRRSPLRWILSHVARHWWIVIVAVFGAIGNAALASAVPVLVGLAFNAILADPPDLSRLGQIALMIVGSQMVRGVLQLGRNFGAELIGQRLERDIRDELYASLLGKSMTFHNDQPVGDTMARATNDVREINLMFSPGLNLVVGSAIFLIVPLILAPTYHPSLILVPLVFVAGYFLALWQYLTELSPISDAIRQSFGDLNAHLAEALDGIEIVKGTAQEQAESKRFTTNARAYRDHFVRQGDVEARFLPFLLIGLATAGSFLHALLLYRAGSLDLGQVVAYVGLIQLFRFPTFVSLFAYSQVSLGMASARRILDLINRETKLDQNPGGYAGDMRGEIEFHDVTFAYLGESESSLEEVTFHASPGQTVAIVGQTGTGKSTLTHLINRIYDATHGEVLIDGIDVSEWNLAALRRQISVIEQDVFLFSRAISENIAFGCPDATQQEIEAAARAAQAHEFIMSFNEGYNTVVGERGVTLSGGQRQRIALARAFLTNPSILILDDATSSIDSATEDQIQRAIFRASQGRTTLIITHRLSQIRWADLILVLRGGKIAAIGSHEDLMATSEPYRKIFMRYRDD